MTTSPTPSDASLLLRRLVAGEVEAGARVLAAVADTTDPRLLVAAAVLDPDPRWLRRARAHARDSRERQLVELAAARLAGRHELFDALVRDHLVAYPDDLLACWLAGRPHPTSRPDPVPLDESEH